MGKIVSNFFISADGVVEAPDQWHLPYWDDDMAGAVATGFETVEALLMGRRLFDEWAAYWPTSDDEPIATTFNELPKHVVSSTLDDTAAASAWSNTSVVRPSADAVCAVKASVDGDIMMSGSATTVRWLLGEGLLDELRLLVHPIVVGKGQRLFEDDGPTGVPLRVVSCETFASGVLNLAYAPAQG